ncbi:permease [Shimazuella soli]|uniref:permease n=1 Tax=Shimazuella soli TaxID=1892854 RepID=UPI001F0EF48B|nr:permease [Shimazuella soli]
MLRLLKNYYVEILLVFVLASFILFFSSDQFLAFEMDISFLTSFTKNPQLQSLSTIFLSIFLEGLPFILFGVFISSFIHEFVNENGLWRYVPKNPFLSIPMAIVLGFVLPICECGIVPIARRLIEKKLPVYTAFTFLLAAPIVNPVTIFSTYIAFGNDWSMTIVRVALGAGIAIVMGGLFYLFFQNIPVLKEIPNTCDHDHESCCTTDQAGHEHSHTENWRERVEYALHHAIFEFLNMGKYFVLGAFLAACFQTFIGFSAIQSTGKYEWLSIVLLMGIAFGLSICSSSDAFIAASFRNAVGAAPLFAFLVYGPIMDLKNLLMMSGSFRPTVIWFFWSGTTVLTIVSVVFFL